MWFYTSNKFATNSALVFKIQRANDLYSWDASYSVWEVSCRFSFCCRSSYAEYDDGSAQVTLCDYLFSLVFKAQLCSDHIFGPILEAEFYQLYPPDPLGLLWSAGQTGAAKPLVSYRASSRGPMAALPSQQCAWRDQAVDGLSRTSGPQQLCSCPRRWWASVECSVRGPCSTGDSAFWESPAASPEEGTVTISLQQGS